MINLDQWKEQDDAYVQQAAGSREAPKPEPPQGLAIFMQSLGDGPVPRSLFFAALSAADHLYGGQRSPRYVIVRDAVVTFYGEHKPNPGNDAVTRLCVPLLGYARTLAHLHGVAYHAQTLADKGVKPDHVRFSDMHALGEYTQRLLLEALKFAGHHLYIDYMNFITGLISEAQLDEYIKEGAPDAQADVLRIAASVLKDGLRATRLAADAGVGSTADVIKAHRGALESEA